MKLDIGQFPKYQGMEELVTFMTLKVLKMKKTFSWISQHILRETFKGKFSQMRYFLDISIFAVIASLIFYIYMIKWMIFTKKLPILIVNYMLLLNICLHFIHMYFQAKIVTYNIICRKIFKSLKNTLLILTFNLNFKISVTLKTFLTFEVNNFFLILECFS